MARVSLTALAAAMVVIGMAGAASAVPSRDSDYYYGSYDGPSDPHWLMDERAQCWAYDSNAGPYDTITWSGVCRDGRADGPGTLAFFNRGRMFERLTGTFNEGMLEDGHVSIEWSDGARYDGDQSGGQFNGYGELIAADGTRYAGEWRDDKFVDPGEHSARADQQGDEQDGDVPGASSEAMSDEPPVADAPETPPSGSDNGPAPAIDTQASSTRAPEPQQASMPEQPAPPPTPSPATKGASAKAIPLSPKEAQDQWSLLHGMQAKLVAADGSKLSLAVEEGGRLARTFTRPDGSVSKSELALLGDRIGTLSDDDGNVTATFRVDDHALTINYADGKIDTLAVNADGGFTEESQSPGAKSVEMSWYPSGHVFAHESDTSKIPFRPAVTVAAPSHQMHRQAASVAHKTPAHLVAEVEPQIRPMPKPVAPLPVAPPPVAPPPPPAKDPVIPARAVAKATVDLSANLPKPEPKPLLHLAEREPTSPSAHGPDRKHGKHHREKEHSTEVALASPPEPAPHVTATAPVAHAEPAPAHAETAPLPPVTTVNVRVSQVHTIEGAEAPPMRRSASECLSIESNGTHFGFRNNCGNDIQFAYCVMNGNNRLTACGQSAVPGSVEGHGFSALIADLSLKDQNANHQFRWIGCVGGAGEVVPRLDRADPPLGRCLHESDLPQGSERADAKRLER